MSDKNMNAFDYTQMCIKKYGVKTIENRAIPDYRDGMLPVQRRLMYCAHRLGTAKHKSARLIGDCFLAGTQVSTPNGLVAIENLEVGDYVNTSRGARVVTHTIANPPSDMYELRLKDGKSVVMTKDQTVKVKIGDKFYWKKACDLTETDIVVVEY